MTSSERLKQEHALRFKGIKECRARVRRMLCEHLWDADWEGVTNVIEVHINRLRAKVDRGFEGRLIHTVRGIGYAFRTE